MQTTPPDKPTGSPEPPNRQRPGSSDEDLSSWWRMTGLGVEFIVAVGLFGAIGWWADRRLGTNPWLTLVGVAVGFAVGLYGVIRAAMKSFK
jgi:F0F1-type ATP synthase assembly protein I